jgi:prevent-host-death family protein
MVATIATWRCLMVIAGVRELKNQLPKYLEMVKKGGKVIVTDRGKPVAILHDLSTVDVNAGRDEIIAFLAASGKVRLPEREGGIREFDGTILEGKSIRDTVIEDRR